MVQSANFSLPLSKAVDADSLGHALRTYDLLLGEERPGHDGLTIDKDWARVCNVLDCSRTDGSIALMTIGYPTVGNMLWLFTILVVHHLFALGENLGNGRKQTRLAGGARLPLGLGIACELQMLMH